MWPKLHTRTSDQSIALFEWLAMWQRDQTRLCIHSHQKIALAYFKKVKVPQSYSYSTLCDPMDFSPWNSSGQNSGAGSLSLLQGIFPTQGSNPGLLHCRQILYQLRAKGSPGILEWVAYSFSRGIFPTQESKQSLLHCRQILYQLNYQGSLIEWAAQFKVRVHATL